MKFLFFNLFIFSFFYFVYICSFIHLFISIFILSSRESDDKVLYELA